MKKVLFIILISTLFAPLIGWGQGCMESSSEDGVSVVGYIQPQFEYNFLGDDIEGQSMDESKFYFNRARVGVVGNIPYDFSYYAMLEISPTLGGPKLLDAFISYNGFGPWAKISIGQFKSPFGIELSTPCHKLHTIDRSIVVNNLAAPFRDIGLMVTGGTNDLSILGSKTENFIGYQFAILNGTGMNVLDDNVKKDLVGRVTLHPFEFVTLGASYRFGKHPALVEDAEDDERKRYGFDVELKYKNFLVQGEYINGSDVGSYTTGGGCGDPFEIHQGSVDRNGFFVQAMYMTPWNVQPLVKVERYDPNIDDDAVDDMQNVITYGLNYFFNEWTRMQINYLYRAEENGKVEIPNDALIVQFQVAF